MQNNEAPPDGVSGVSSKDTKHSSRRMEEATHTPSRRRVKLGSAANFYFKYINPGQKSVRHTNANSNDDSPVMMEDSIDGGGDTGTISIPGFQLGTDGPHSHLSLADTSRFSIAASSSGSEASDLLNKSALSDTTELTASNFILVTTSKQQMMNFMGRQARQVEVEEGKQQSVEPPKEFEAAHGNLNASDNSQGRQTATTKREKTGNTGPTTDVGPNGPDDKKQSTPESSRLAASANSFVSENENISGEAKSYTAMKIGASPSLRSRISSSPASLRKFHDDLRNSRMQRQLQREEDARRRLSIDTGEHSIRSMHAQLESLTTDTVFSRQRLPPPFTQPSQTSTQESVSTLASSRKSETLGDIHGVRRASESNTTEYASLSDIVAILGSDKSADDGQQEYEGSILMGSQSSGTSGTERNEETSNHTDTGNLSFLAKSPNDAEKVSEFSPSAPSSNIPPNVEISRRTNSLYGIAAEQYPPADLGYNNAKQRPKESVSPLPSPSVKPSMTPGSRLKWTPSKLMSSPRRIINPLSSYSPARNTRSSTKRRSNFSHQAARVKPAFSSPENTLDSVGSISDGQILDKADSSWHRESRTGSSEIHRSARSEATSTSRRSDDTVSLADMADVFGDVYVDPSPSVQETPSSSAVTRADTKPVDVQETASISDVVEILGLQNSTDQSSSRHDIDHSPSAKPNHTPSSFQRGNENVTDSSTHDTASISDINEILGVGLSDGERSSLRSSASLFADSNEWSRKVSVLREQTHGKSSCTKSRSADVFPNYDKSDKATTSTLDPFHDESNRPIEDPTRTSSRNFDSEVKTAPSFVDSESNFPDLEFFTANEANISHNRNDDKSSSPQTTSSIHNRGGTSRSENEATPSTPRGQDSSPAVRNALSGKENNFDKLSSSTQPQREPMRLVPNSHVKPTPTKLPPTPRRVLNPRNPDSPARNTRSTTAGRSPSREERYSEMEESFEKQERDVFHSGIKRGNEGVPSLSKRLRSTAYASDVKNLEEESFIDSSSPSRFQPLKPLGILSTRKSRFDSLGNRFSQRSVAFGSPEAAEYNIGSPSVSLTPMPKGRAKELFRVPSSNASDGDDSKMQSGIDEYGKDETVEIESDLNILVDRIRVESMGDSPELSPIAMRKLNTETFFLPRNMNATMTQLATTSMDTADVLQTLPGDVIKQQEDTTVELEGNMDRLIAETARAADQTALFQNDWRDSPDSMDMTDAESIASLHSRSDKFTSQFSVPMDAQRLDFTCATQDFELSSDKMLIVEGKTVELEGNMTSLLAVAGINQTKEGVERNEEVGSSGNRGDTNHSMSLETSKAKSATSFESLSSVEDAALSLDNSTGNESIRSDISTRKALASSSFCLGQGNAELSYEEVLEVNKSGWRDKSVSFSETTEFIQSLASSTPCTDRLPFSSDELDNFSRILALETTKGLDEIESDALVQLGKSVNNMDGIIFEPVCQFFEAVSGEVERRTAPEDAKDKKLSELSQADATLLSIFHTRLQSTELQDGRVKESFYRLVTAGRNLVYGDWNQWLGNVLESSKGLFAGISNGLSDDTRSLEEAINDCKTIETKLSLFNDRKAKRARRKSNMRRLGVVKRLDDDIKALESQLCEAKSNLDSLRDEEMQLAKSKATLQDILHLSSDFEILRSEVESTQKAVLSLRGLHSWYMGALRQTDLEFIGVGLCNETCFSLVYTGSQSEETIQANLLPLSPQPKLISLSRHTPTIMAFVETCVQRLASSMQHVPLKVPSEISDHMQNFMWRIGRLDIIARELHILRRRYKAKLGRKSQDLFSLSVELEGTSASVSAEFEINSLYPSLPVDVRLDLMRGKLDLDVLQRTLIKNAKPGFGSISKACDIIQSFLV